MQGEKNPFLNRESEENLHLDARARLGESRGLKGIREGGKRAVFA